MLWTLALGLKAVLLETPHLIPQPISQSFAPSGFFEFSAKTKLISDTTETKFLSSMFKRAAGFSLSGRGATNKIIFKRVSDTRRVRPDYYILEVSPKQVVVNYTSDGGAFYAIQTLRQLLPTAIESNQVVRGTKWQIPICKIEDGPRFSWRGMMLDVSRHFFPVSFIKKTLDEMALLKLNTFHWHLVDDGGWRIEIKKYPKLTEIGAWRLDTGEIWPGGPWNYENLQFINSKHPKRYGGFYTQDQIREVVRYAAERHIDVVPEIEMPGHSLGAAVAYPELICDNVKPAKPGMSTSNVYCAGKDSTLKFLENVLDEVRTLFPSQFIHIGADEVLKNFWHECPQCQARMKKEGLKSEHELQSWFVRHFDDNLSKHGRRLVGWDEILEGGLAPGATVMSWRGTEGGIAAAKAGRNVVMSPTSHCYFDYSYNQISTEQVYGYEPVPDVLSPEEGARILGGQYNVWTERIATIDRCEELQFPRALAMAEVLWSPKESRNWINFSARQMQFLKRLEALKINYHMPAPQTEYAAIFGQSPLTVRATKVPGLTLKYTLDGSIPNKKSPLYSGDLIVKAKPNGVTRVTFAFVNSAGKASDPTTVDCSSLDQSLDTKSLTPGLICHRYTFENEPSKMPDLRLPTGTSVVTEISDNARPRKNKFAVHWKGFIKAPVTGRYEFLLTSDDGSIFSLGSATVINHDGPHGATGKSATAWLQAGLFPLSLKWYDQGGGNSLTFQIRKPGGQWTEIPADWLFHAN